MNLSAFARDLRMAVAAALAVLAVTMLAIVMLAGPRHADVRYLLPAITVASQTWQLTVIDSAGMGVNPAAVTVPATGPAGSARTAAATVDHG
jgi:hypothetical protein